MREALLFNMRYFAQVKIHPSSKSFNKFGFLALNIVPISASTLLGEMSHICGPLKFEFSNEV